MYFLCVVCLDDIDMCVVNYIALNISLRLLSRISFCYYDCILFSLCIESIALLNEHIT